VLDEGAEPARRNQALIDAPSAVRAASFADTGPDIFGGIGEIFASGATSEVAHARNQPQPETQPAAATPPSAFEAPSPAQPTPPSPGGITPPPPEAASPPAAAPSSEPDDLLKLKGVGPKLATRLNSLGVDRYEQIAAWNEEDIDRIDAQLGTFAGRIRRDNWVEQAKFLAAGDVAGFEATFGKL
jgi:predicted flap endonuclease-1-like 5' DNA nuclease